MISVYILSVFINSVINHAVLVFPNPWDNNPSKKYPCGNANGPLSTFDIVNITLGTDTNVLGWKVIAADGSGTVTGYIDPLAGYNFTIPFPDLAGNAPSVGSYTYVFSLPNGLVCKGPGQTCTARIASSSNWNSCFTFKISTDPSFNETTSQRKSTYSCQTIQNLGFCTQFNNKEVNVPVGSNPITIDASVSAFYNQAINNVNVFANGQSSQCTSSLPFVLCAQAFPGGYCGQSSYLKLPSSSYCQDSLNACAVTDSHRGLIDCSSLSSATLVAPSSGTSKKFKEVSFFALALNVILILLFTL